jgi:hypothetical protein
MRIWKFPISLDRIRGDGDYALTMPDGAELLSVQTQVSDEDGFWLWACVDPDACQTARRLWVVGTGFDLPESLGRFIGTVQLYGGSLVLHVFEAVS